MNWTSIGIGAACGAGWSISNWLKNRAADGGFERFDLKTALPAVVIGTVVGAVASWKGISMEEGYAWLGAVGVIPILHNVLKTGVRHLGATPSGILADLKDPDAKPGTPTL